MVCAANHGRTLLRCLLLSAAFVVPLQLPIQYLIHTISMTLPSFCSTHQNADSSSSSSSSSSS